MRGGGRLDVESGRVDREHARDQVEGLAARLVRVRVRVRVRG